MDFLLENFWTLTVTGLSLGAIYSLIALGYTLVYGVLQLINFAHSEVFMYGAFAATWTVTALGGSSSAGLGEVVALLFAGLAAAMIVSGIVALVLERVAYRRLRKQGSPRLIVLISAIGASFVLAEAMGLRDKIFGFVGLDDDLAPYVRNARDSKGFPEIIDVSQVFTLGDYQVTNVDIMVITSSLLMMLALDQFVARTRFGRGIRAVSQDPEAAALMGVNSDRSVQLTFLLGGLMAGVAAMLYMIKVGSVRFDTGFLLGVKAFTAAVLGGIGNLRGALIGGLILGLAENYGAALIGTEWQDVVAFTLLVVILLFRPTGLLGESLGKART